jgi:hypothetical protein
VIAIYNSSARNHFFFPQFKPHSSSEGETGLYPEAAAAAGRKGELKLGFRNRWHSLKMQRNACVRNVGCLSDRLKASRELSESCPLDP